MDHATVSTAATVSAPSAPLREVILRQPGEGPGTWFLDNLLVTKVLAEEGAPFGVVEAHLPAGSRTPFHAHQGEDEAFYVLDGELTFFLEGGRAHRAVPGSYVHVPRGVAHGFRTEAPVRMLVLAGANGFFAMTREAGDPAPRHELPPPAAPDLARLGAAAARYRIDLLGPLPEEASAAV